MLTAAHDDAVAGRGRLVMLAGEPGIGKTRLVQELASRAKESGTQVLWGWCYEGEGAPSYWPWVDSLRTYIQSTEPDLLKIQLGNGAATIGEMIPEVLEMLDGVQPAPTMEPDQARFRLFDAITRFLKTASEDSPLLLVIDDLQWADQPSLVLLEFLAQQLDASRILVVGTYRDTEAPPESPLGESLARLARLASFQRRTITGLLPDDVGRFVRSETGIPPPEQILNAIHSHTEGNPFFLGEVVRYLAEQGRLDEASEDSSGPGNLGVPPSIRDVIGQRLLRLSEACNRALTTAAVIGREFEFNLLAELTDSTNVGAVLDLMDEAISARIIEDLPGATVRYQFRHSLMQQTLNENISAGCLVQGGRESIIQGIGRIRTVQDIGDTVVTVRSGKPIAVSDLGAVMIGAAIKRGTGSASRRGPNWEPITETGVIIAIQKQPGANTLTLTKALDTALDEIQASLPEGMLINKHLFRQANFIEVSIDNTIEALRDGGIMVILAVVAFLMSFRASVITLLAIPMSLVIAVLTLKLFGSSINTMTLGGMAIAIGSSDVRCGKSSARASRPDCAR